MITAVSITYTDDEVVEYETDREPWAYKGMLCIGSPGNFDSAAATRIPVARVVSYELIVAADLANA